MLLFLYGVMLNLAPLPFERVVGLYIATLFVVWQIVSFFTFRSVPSFPILAGGALIVVAAARPQIDGSRQRELRGLDAAVDLARTRKGAAHQAHLLRRRSVKEKPHD